MSIAFWSKTPELDTDEVGIVETVYITKIIMSFQAGTRTVDATIPDSAVPPACLLCAVAFAG